MKILEDLLTRLGGRPAPPPPAPVEGPPPLWTWHMMAGKCRNGAHRDAGRTAHVIPNNEALGLPAQHVPLCGARSDSFWSEPMIVAAPRRCPDCVRFQAEKKPCPACGLWVLPTKAGGLRAHRCLRPCPACRARMYPDHVHLCAEEGAPSV